jgi:5-methyltetrahydrofolate--homocysteine methyltransferase
LHKEIDPGIEVKNLLEQLRRGCIFVADGALGTMLMERGLESGRPPESMNLEQPGVLEEVAREYLDAGADIVQSNTFGASRLKLVQYSLDGQVEQINANAVAAVKRAVEGRAYVSGSCGPTGEFLRPYGEVEPEEMLSVFEEQIGVLVAHGVDILCIETMIDLQEATSAVRAARRVSSSVPVMATMTFEQTSRGFYTVMGVSIRDAVEGLLDAGADIVGSNCGNGIEKMIAIARQMKEHTEVPIIIQANAGMPIFKDDKVFYPETPEFMAEKAHALLNLGVSIIGGCCGTTPAHIKALREAMDSWKRQGILSQD